MNICMKWLISVIVLLYAISGCTFLKIESNAEESSAAIPFPELKNPDLVLFNMIDAKNGWGLTANHVLRTFDGGEKWYDVTPPGLVSVDFVPFYALDELHFWLLFPDPNREKNSILYRTTDGGKTWESYSVPLGTAQIQFLDENIGFAISDLGSTGLSHAIAILKTTDGGQNWDIVFSHQGGIEQDLPFSGTKYGLTFLDPQHAWVGGSIPMQGYVYFYRSQDGGRSWSHQNIVIPEPYSEFYAGANPPIFFSATDGILPVDLYGSSYSRIFYRTTDGGQTWQPGARIISLGLYSPVSFETIFVWTGSSKLYVSHDSGQSWQTIETNVDLSDALIGMQFVDQKTGWALTVSDKQGTSLYKTTDGGATWTLILP